MVKHDDGGTTVVKYKSPEVCGGGGQGVRGDHKCSRLQEAVHQCRIYVVVAVPLCGHEKRKGTVGRQHVHAPVLLAVPGQQRHAALLHIQVRGDRV